MNLDFRPAVFSIAFFLLALVAVPAQQLVIEQAPILTGGGQATVTYDNPAMGGQEIVVLVTGHDGTMQQVHVSLDASGKGSGSFTVPSTWRSAEFQAPSVASQVLPVS